MFLSGSFLHTAAVVWILQSSVASCSPTKSPAIAGVVSLKQVVQIPHVPNAENLAVRRNGEILVTSTTSTSLFQVSPDGNKAPIEVARFPNATGLLGITELEQDVFYVVASANLSGKATAPGANSVWKVDLRASCNSANEAITPRAEVSLVATILGAQLLNGLCRLDPKDTTNLLIADSAAGNVVKLNVHTATYEVVIQDPTMINLPTGFIQVAVNGIHVHKTDLFYTSLNQGLFAKIPISLKTGRATGPAEVIVNETFGDDFVLSKDGRKAWIAMNGQNELVEVNIPGKSARVIANSTFLSQDSSVAFGRSEFDRNSLYITGAGIFGGNSTVSASVVRADFP